MTGGAIHGYDSTPPRLSTTAHFPPTFSQTVTIALNDCSSFGGFSGVSWLHLSEAKKLHGAWLDSSSCDCLIAADGAKVGG